MNWIDIKDREPEDSGNVLVSVKLNYSDVPMVTVSWYNRLMRCFPGLEPYMTVTHWMPLPEPPEEVAP